MTHPDDQTFDNKIIRHYSKDGAFFDMSVDQTIALKKNNWKGWLCAASQESIYIDFDGFVFIANCRAGGPLGSIFDGFEIPKDWIKCPIEFCGCGADIMIPKTATEADKSLLKNLNSIPHQEGIEKRTTQTQVPSQAVELSFRDNRKQVFWDLHRRCNYACSYCWPEVHNDYEEVKPYSVLLAATDQLLEKFGQGRPLRFMFGGGEPTIIPKFIEWMQYIQSKGSYSVVTTNGSRQPSYFRELIKCCNINMSIHFESADIDRIVNNVSAILEEKALNPRIGGLEIKIMCPPGRVDDSVNLKRRLFEIPGFKETINWSIVPIRSIERNDVLVDYQDKEFERLKQEIDL
jgi:organic radical activating enzyme